MAVDDNIKFVLMGDNTGLRFTLNDSSERFIKFGGEADKAMKKAGDSGSFLKDQIAGIAAAVSVGAFAAFVGRTVDMMDHLDETAQKAGLTTEVLSEYSYAAKFASLDTDEMTKTLVKLSGSLQDAKEGQKEAVELFRRLKLDPKNIQDADQLLLALAERFAAMPDGIQKTALAADVLGEKLGPRLIPLLNLGREGIEGLRKEAHDLGLVVTNEAGAGAAKLNDQLDRLHGAVQGVGVQIASNLVPGLSNLATKWAENVRQGGLFAGTLKTIGQRIKEMLGQDDLSKQEQAMRTVSARLRAVADEIVRLQTAVNENPNAFEVVPGAVGQTAVKSVDKLRVLRQEYERLSRAAALLREQVLKGADALVNPPDTLGAGGFMGPIKPAEPFTPLAKKPQADAPKAEKSEMSVYEEKLALEQQFLAVAGETRLLNKQQELDYWRTVLDTATLTTADKVAVTRKVALLEVDIAKDKASKVKQVEEEQSRTSEQLALLKVDSEQIAAQALLDSGSITQQQLLALQMQFEGERLNIQAAALQERLRLLEQDPNTNPAEMARLQNQILVLEQQSQNKRAQLQAEMANAGNFGEIFKGVGDTFGQTLDNLLTRSTTWAGALGALWGRVRANFINTIVTEPFNAWLASQGRMLAMKLGFMTQEQTMDAASSASKIGLKVAETTTIASANAVQAGTGAAASQASIPFVGPALALAAMAAVFAAVSGLGGGIASAEGGFDIPRGLNPMAQLHEREMVLPAKHADVIRSLADGGAMGGGVGGGIVTYNDHSGTLSQSQIRRNARVIADELNRLGRNGYRPKDGT